MKLRVMLALTTFGCALSTTAMASDVAVVVAASSPASALTSDQVADIFLGKNTSLPGAGQAVPVDLAESAAVRDEFYSKVAGKTAAQMKAYWAKQIFTGKVQPPKAVADNAAVKSAVAGNPNAIGYIDKSAVDGSVKVLLTVK